TGPTGEWTYAHRRALRIAAVGVIALIFVSWCHPTMLVVILLAVILLVLLGLIELISRPRPRPRRRRRQASLNRGGGPAEPLSFATTSAGNLLPPAPVPVLGCLQRALGPRPVQIGRASCRERT